MRRTRAFTLIEVLVALAIVAVALAAGMRALAQSADGATSLKMRTLALWVAENPLARAQLADPGVPDYALARLTGYLGNARR